MTTEQRRAKLKYADVVLRPEVGHIFAFDIGSSRECIEAGKREAEKKIHEVFSLLK